MALTSLEQQELQSILSGGQAGGKRFGRVPTGIVDLSTGQIVQSPQTLLQASPATIGIPQVTVPQMDFAKQQAIQQEQARLNAVKIQAQNLAKSGAGSVQINQFLAGLSPADRALVSPLFGVNVSPPTSLQIPLQREPLRADVPATIPAVVTGQAISQGSVVDDLRRFLQRQEEAQQQFATKQAELRERQRLFQAGAAQVEGQQIPTPLIGGQLQALKERTALELQPLTNELQAISDRLGVGKDTFQNLISLYRAAQPDTQIITETDQAGNVTSVVVDKRTGAEVGRANLGQIGKPQQPPVGLLTATGAIDRLLTPQEQILYGAPAGTKISEVTGEIPATAATRKELTSFSQALPIVDSIKSLLGQIDLAKDIKQTPLRGAKLTAKAFLPATIEGQYKGQVDTFLTLLARAAGERGVVTDQDVGRVKRAIPGFFDTRKSAEEKLTRLSGILKEVQARAAAGFKGQVIGGPEKNQDPLGIRK